MIEAVSKNIFVFRMCSLSQCWWMWSWRGHEPGSDSQVSPLESTEADPSYFANSNKTQTKLKFFPAEEMSHGLGITRNFILMLCIKIASRFWNDYNEFVCSVKSGEKICLGSIYSVWSLSWRPPPSPPNSPRCWKMLGQRRFVLVRW